MTVETENKKTGPYNGDDVTSVFAYDFRIIKDTHMRVLKEKISDLSQTELVLNTDYTVDGVKNQNGGNVTLAGAEAPSQSGYRYMFLRDSPFLQETDLSTGGPFNAEVLEERFDWHMELMQQMQEELDRTLKVSETGTDPVDQAQAFADQASTSATNASTSETNASTSETNAAASAASAAADAASIAASAAQISTNASDIDALEAFRGVLDALDGLIVGDGLGGYSAILLDGASTDYIAGDGTKQALPPGAGLFIDEVSDGTNPYTVTSPTIDQTAGKQYEFFITIQGGPGTANFTGVFFFDSAGAIQTLAYTNNISGSLSINGSDQLVITGVANNYQISVREIN